jgi:hypothetical protein
MNQCDVCETTQAALAAIVKELETIDYRQPPTPEAALLQLYRLQLALKRLLKEPTNA